MKELAFYFLHDLKEFQERFQRILERTPRRTPKGKKGKKSGSTSVEFWIAFFRSMASSIQNTQLGKELGINHVCFSISKISGSDVQVLKLAFNINDNGQNKVILRSISIGERDDVPNRNLYSEKEIEVFEDRIFGKTARTDSATTINLKKVDSKVLHINIKDSEIQRQGNNKNGQGSSGTDAENIKLVKPLQLGKDRQGQDKTLDTMLDLISNPASASEENTKAFFSDLIRLYNNNNDPEFDVSGDLEAAAHGFTYGLFTLIYKHKYKLDTYVEQSAGKGFLDIAVIFRKMYVNDQDRIINTDAGSRIIGEFKIGDTKDTSAQAAIDQMINGGYNYNLYGRTDSEGLIAVGLNPNRKNNSERIKVDLSLRPQSTKNFLSEIVKWHQSIKKSKVENLLENIYYSIRSEEPLDLVILGNFLSQDTISNKKVFTIDSEEFTYYLENSEHGKRSDATVTIFSFKENNKDIILTITDTDQEVNAVYKKKIQNQELGSRRSKTKSHIFSSTSIQEELEHAVIQIQKQENIHTGKRIDIIINSKTENPSGIKIHKKFNDRNKLKSYLQDITIQNIKDLPKTDRKTSTKYSTYDCNIYIDAKKLLLELINSSDDIENTNKVAFKELLLKIQDLITSEAEFKSFMHGLYLTQFKPEASLGHGRIDGIIRCDNGKVIGIEFKFNEKDIKKVAETQVQEYIKHFKSFTDEKEIEGIVLNFNNQRRPNDDIITCYPLKEPVDHSTSDEGGNSPEKPRITGEDINVEKTLSEVELSKTTGANSDLKRPIEETFSNLEDFQNRGQNVGLKKMKGSDGTGCSWMQRRKRNVESCINEEASDDFLYEPLEKDIAATKEQIKEAKLYAQVAMMLSLHSNMGEANAALDSILTYNRNVGEIINEGAQNHSTRELKLLQDHYKAAQDFIARYYNLNAENGLNNRLLQDYSGKADHHNSWLVDNGSHSFLVISDKNRYTLYSPDFNYRYLFQTKEGTTFSEVIGLAKAFFKWRSGSTKHKIYTLSRDDNLLQESAEFLKGHPILANPDQFLSDQVLLSRDYHNAIEGISVQTIRALFSIDDTPVDIARLNSDFFKDYGDKIRFRVEALHKILPFLREQESIALVAILKRYDIYADTSYLDKLSINKNKRAILAAYTTQVMRDLKEKDTITPERLSEISWNTIGKELEKYPDISPTHKAQIVATSKSIHESAFKKIWIKGQGVATQALFFLPDIIRAANTGNADSLVQNIEMLGGDAAFNQFYTKLIEGLESVGSVGAASLLRKIPITSPIFKIVVIHSVVELHQQLATLPYDSEQRDIITHQLAEQYATLGLMVAELFGAETGPLWVALIMEQVMYGGESFRKLHHLHIDLGEAILMSLGFEHDKFEDIMEDRRLVSRNLAMMNSTENALKMQSGWKIVKVPVLGRTEWNRVNEDEIPEYVKNQAKKMEELIPDSSFRHILGHIVKQLEIAEFKKFIKYNRDLLYPRSHVYEITRLPNDDYWEGASYYVTQKDTTIKFAFYDSTSCNEVNIFQSEASEKDFQHKLVQPVEDDAYCEKERPSGRFGINLHVPRGLRPEPKYIKIQGGLAAVYVNTKNPLDKIAQRTMYVVFDPREGNLEIDLDDLGRVINELNRQHRPAPSLSNIDKYILVTHVTHKLYSGSIVFPENANNKFSLQASSNTIISRYYIDVTIPFQIQDKSSITQFVFLSPIDHNTNSTIDEGKHLISQILQGKYSTIHKMYINGPNIGKYDIRYAKYFRIIVNGQNVERVASISDSSIILEGNREYLELALSNILINNNLELSAKHIKVSGVQGKDHNSLLILSQDVETFNLTIAGNIIISKKRTDLYVIANDKAIKPVLHYSGQFYMDTFLYKLQVANLHPVLDSIISTPFVATFNIMESIRCIWKTRDSSNMLSIESSQDSKHYFLLLKSDSAYLKVLDSNNQLIRIEVKHYFPKGSLDDGLILKNNGNFTVSDNSSLFNLNEYKGAVASLIFQSDQPYKVLHHFPYKDSVTINNIDYTIREGRIYVLTKGGEIDANQLIKYRQSNGNNAIVVPIFTNTLPKDTNISLTEDKLHINNAIFQNLPDDAQLHFKKIKHSFSIKELKDTLSSQLDLGDSDHHRNRRKVDVDSELVTSSAINCVKNCESESSINAKNGSALTGDSLSYIAPGISQSKIVHKKDPKNLSIKDTPNGDFNTISSSSNRLEFWPISLIKKVGKTVLSILPSNWLSSSKEKSDEDLPERNLLQSEPLVAQQPLVKVAEASNTLLKVDVDSSDHQRTPLNVSPAGPTLLEMGDQWVKNADVNGLLTWGTLLTRKWTGHRPKAAKAPSYNVEMDIKLSIRSHELVDAFMDKVLDHAQACGIRKTVSNALKNPKLYGQAIDTVHKNLAKGQLDGITVPLFKQLVQQNISKIALKSTPKQANELLASIRKDLLNIQQQFLKQEVSLESKSSAAVLANTTTDINLLKQEICSIGPIDQLADTNSLLSNTYNIKDTLVQNSLYYDN